MGGNVTDAHARLRWGSGHTGKAPHNSSCAGLSLWAIPDSNR